MLRTFFSRLQSLFRRRFLETEFVSEAEDHIVLLTDRFIQQGMTPAEARYAAQRPFGGISQMKEELRDRRGFPFIELCCKTPAISSASFVSPRCLPSRPF